MPHKFPLGQQVEFHPLGTLRALTAGPYEIVQLMPADAAGFQYRIRSKADGHERVVIEREILPLPAQSGS